MGTARRLAGAAAWVVLALVIVAMWPVALGGRTAYIMVSGTSMEPTMHTGDLAILRQRSSYDVGDIVAYRIPKGTPGEGFLVIHRIIGGDGARGYVLQGDNRGHRDVWRPTDGDVVGRRIALVPRLGRAVGRISSPSGVAAFLAGVVMVLVVSYRPARARSTDEPPVPRRARVGARARRSRHP